MRPSRLQREELLLRFVFLNAEKDRLLHLFQRGFENKERLELIAWECREVQKLWPKEDSHKWTIN